MESSPPTRTVPSSPLRPAQADVPGFQPGTSAITAPEYPTGQRVVAPGDLPGHVRAPHRFLRSPATYLLLGLNVAVFLLMVRSGVNGMLPSPLQLIHFGANNATLVLHGQWWRLVTAMFVHVGFAHLATNMWCLWNLGMLGEPLLGFSGMLAVYLLTGAAGNLLSLAASVLSELLVNSPLFSLIQWIGASMDQVGAGASGAVFGIAGILIVLLSNSRLAQPRNGNTGIPIRELAALRRSVINFAGINLLIGLGSAFLPLIRIDNMAHLGGFACGLAMGVPLLPRMTSGRRLYLQRQKLVFAMSALLLGLVGFWISKLHG